MTSYYYNYQNASVCCFLVQIKASYCSLILSGIDKCKYESKNEMNSGSCSPILLS